MQAVGSSSSVGVTALAALAHAQRKLATMLGGAASSSHASATLGAAGAAYERLCDLEDKYAAAWAEREEADQAAAELQGHVDRLIGERAAAERLAAEQRAVIGAIEARWDALQDEARGDSLGAPSAAAAASAAPMASSSAGHTGMLQPGFKQSQIRRPSVTTASLGGAAAAAAAAAAPTAPPTTHASKLVQPGFKRRPSADASASAPAAGGRRWSRSNRP